MKKILCYLLLFAMLLSLLPVSAQAVTVSSDTTITIAPGVQESSVKLSSGHKGFMLQLAPNAKASFRVSYPGYYTKGSTAESRAAAAASLPGARKPVMAQAKDFEAATGQDVIFATNGNFFWGETCVPMGGIIAEGNVIHPQDENAKMYFALLKDGTYAIRSYTEDDSDVLECVAGRQWLVKNGVKQTQNNEQISARTLVGIKADGTVVVFCVEGHTNVSGVTINDTCELMYSLGCVNAINLDGGGSTTFATQRSNATSMTIRNVLPDADGERAVMSSLLLVREPDADSLFFDFTNDAAAQKRYATNLYGGLNFDTGGWHYNHQHDAAPVFNNTAGTMTVKKVAYNTERSIHTVITSTNTSYTGGHPLAYVPGKDDYVQVRMKITGSPDNTVGFRLRYATDDSDASTNTAYTTSLPSSYINSGQYFIITGKLAASYAKYDLITAIRPEIFDLTVPANKTGLTIVYDYIYVGPESGLPTPHNYQAVVTAPTCTTGGHTTYTCSICGKTYTGDATQALGHSYGYTNTGLDHLAACTRCNETFTEAHSYINGLCVCGDAEIKEPMVYEGFKIYHTLNLASGISLTYAVPKSQLEGFDMETVYMDCAMEDKTVRVLPTDAGNYYYFTLTELTAVRMNDRVSAVLYGTKDRQPYYSATDDYSIADYAYAQLNNASAEAVLKTLCADLLRYGAAAQQFKNYRTDAPADSAMTEAHRALLSDLDAVTFSNVNGTLEDLQNPTVAWVGKTLVLDSNVSLKYVVNVSEFQGDLSELCLHISYMDIEGNPKSAVVTELEAYSADKGWYAFTFDGLLAAELRCALSAQVYAGSTPVSVTLRYSPDTYGNGQTGALGHLCKALIAYSDSAKAFFTKS